MLKLNLSHLAALCPSLDPWEFIYLSLESGTQMSFIQHLVEHSPSKSVQLGNFKAAFNQGHNTVQSSIALTFFQPPYTLGQEPQKSKTT